MDVARSAPQGGLNSLSSLTGIKEGRQGLMVLRVKPTPTRFPTNILYIPMDNTLLHSIYQVCVTREVYRWRAIDKSIVF